MKKSDAEYHKGHILRDGAKEYLEWAEEVLNNEWEDRGLQKETYTKMKEDMRSYYNVLEDMYVWFQS
jgi:hypothetical protein